MIKKWWRNISYLGTSLAPARTDARRWVLANQLSAIILCIGFLSLAVLPAYVDGETGAFNLPAFLRILGFTLAGGLSLLMSAKGRIQWSKLILSLLVPTALLIPYLAGATFPAYELFAIPMLALVIPLIPYMLFNPFTERGWFIIGVVFSLVCWAAIDQLIIMGIPDPNAIADYFQENYLAYKITTFYYFLFTQLGLYYMAKTNYRHEHNLQVQLEEIQEQNEEIAVQNEELTEHRHLIEEQNDELRQQQENIQKINDNLEYMVEQRTQELEKQNHQLAEYAFVNGHLLRGPLCRVQGLIYLMELSGKLDKDDPMYSHLRESVEEFAEVVTRINLLVNEGNHFDRYDFAQALSHILPSNLPPQNTTD